jgi:hypothetical protein
MVNDDMFDDRDNALAKDDNIPCPAYEVCAKLGTAMDSCLMINKLSFSPLILRPQAETDLHGLENISEDLETPDDVSTRYQQTIEYDRSTKTSNETIELHYLYDKLNHVQCCLSSIVLLLSHKAT